MVEGGVGGRGIDGGARVGLGGLLGCAWGRVLEQGGPAGVDGVTLGRYGGRLGENLRVLGDLMERGSYFPGPVRVVDVPTVDLPGRDGTVRLGTLNVVDRVAQTAMVLAVEDSLECVFHADSYGHRAGRSSLDAVAVCRERFARRAWALDVRIRDFFASVPWDLILGALARHTDEQWLVYVRRWLAAPVLTADGSLAARAGKGIMQGCPVSPLLTNLVLHDVFDAWVTRVFPAVQFERFADNVVIHCDSERDASRLRSALACRLVGMGLELDFERARVVCCKDSGRRGTFEHVAAFTFCGYAFPPRKAKPELFEYWRNCAPSR